jgi:hypothetical protein
VRTSEALPGRPAYRAGAATHELGLRSTTWAPQHSVYLDLSATRLGSGARHSPLVDGSTESALRLGPVPVLKPAGQAGLVSASWRAARACP